MLCRESHFNKVKLERNRSRHLQRNWLKGQRGLRPSAREEIELRAYQIYVERGSADGQHVEDWLQAERELLGKYGNTGRMAKAAAV